MVSTSTPGPDGTDGARIPILDPDPLDPERLSAAGVMPAMGSPSGLRVASADSGARPAVRPPAWLDRALDVLIVGAKAATIACAIDAVMHADSTRLRGKAIRTRAIGYTGGLFIVPVLWRLLPNRGRYPRGLDLAVTVPLLIDAGGNALGLYEEAHLDDAVHFLNAAIVSGVAGALFATQTDKPWQAALAGTGTAITGETAWEIAEWLAQKAGADGMNLTYDDTMADLTESTLGALVGGLLTWLRTPQARADRSGRWRRTLAGWRRAGDPMALLVGRGTVADRTIAAAS